jgi:hypothetical protein
MTKRNGSPIRSGMTKEEVIPAKAGIQSIHKEEWIPFYKGMTENPGFRIKCGMTKRNGSPIRSGMTKRVSG